MSFVSGSKEACATLFRLNPTPMAVIRLKDSKPVDVNDAYVQTFGNTIGSFAHGDEIIKEILQHGFVRNLEVQLRISNEIIRTILLSSEIINIDGDDYVFAVLNDITDRKEMENALRINEARLSSIVNAIPNPVFYKDTQGRYLGCNKAFEDFIGLPKSKIVGSSVFDVSPSELAKRYHDADIALLASGVPQVYESSVRYADSTLRSVIFSKSVFKDHHGYIAGLVGVMVDITERKQSEDALRLFRELLDQSLDPVLVIDPATGLVLDANQTACNVLGYTIDELKKLHTFEFDICLGNAESRNLLAQRIKKEGNATVEGIFRTKGNSMVMVEVSIRYVTIGDKSYHVASARDVTEKRRHEEIIRRSELRYRTLIENTSDIMYSINPDGNFSYISGGVRKLGYEPDEVIGKPMINFIAEDDRAETMKAFVAAIESGKGGKSLFRVITKSGQLLDFEEVGDVLRSLDGKPTQIIGILRDVTVRLKDEEAKIRLERVKSMVETAGAACHELNQPLQAVIGYFDLLSRHKGIESAAPWLEKINLQLTRLSEITKRLNSITRYEVKPYIAGTSIVDIYKASEPEKK
ncbi:MAG: PAS domain S-box protein [Fibrobacteres bacterium]|nr:PAS domain S-box protein [Fibrobacterota bacterium]